MDRLLILPAGGLVGEEVARRLLRAGAEVVCGVRDAVDGERLLTRGIEAPWIPWRDREKVLETIPNVNGLVLVVTGLWPHELPEVQPLVTEIAGLVDEVTVITRVESPGQESWWSTLEEQVEDLAPQWTKFRLAAPMQLFSGPLREELRRHRTLVCRGLSRRIPWVDIRDVGEAIAHRVLQDEPDHQIHTLTGPESLSIVEVAHQLGPAIGRQVSCEVSSGEQLHRFASRTEGDEPLDLYFSELASEPTQVTAPGPSLSRLLRRPATPFGQFVSDYAICWQKRRPKRLNVFLARNPSLFGLAWALLWRMTVLAAIAGLLVASILG